MPDLAGSAELCPIVHRVHALAWRPGAHLHDGWWRKLDLDGWQDDYRTHPGCRRALDALIVQRRAFPVAPLPAAMSESQARLIRLEPRLPALLVALGFYTLRAPELLLLGEYRRALAAVLGDPACEQLATLVPGGGGRVTAAAPDHFHLQLLELGCAWMQRDLGACPAWQALAICFPPSNPQPGLIPEPPLPLLFRMERYL